MFERIDGVSLDVLRVFESAARQLSFTAAASELGTSQPAISQQIKRLSSSWPRGCSTGSTAVSPSPMPVSCC